MARAFADLVAVGLVVKPQGRKGEVLIEPLSDRPGRFASLKRAFVPGAAGEAREVTVRSCWPHKGRFVLKLDGVDSIDAAEMFRGQELRIGEEELDRLPEGSYYHHELVGLSAFGPEGRALGTVKGILETGAGAPVLVIVEALAEGGREHLVPLADEFVTRVDLAGRRMTVALREGADSGAD
jgi:16S rRNA processing protein RimM